MSSRARAALPLHTRIFIGLIAGVVAGVLLNVVLGGSHAAITWTIANVTDPIGQLFLRLMLMSVIPLVFSSIVVGVAGLKDPRKLGRIGFKTLAYCIVTTAVAAVLGVGLVNLVEPGKRIPPETAKALQERYGSDAARRVADLQKPGAPSSPLAQVVKTIVPSNPFAAIAQDPPNMLHLMFFALAIGIALTVVPGEAGAALLRGLEALYRVSAKLIELIMLFAPYAVACLMFSNVARFGLDLLVALGWFVFVAAFGLALQLFAVYSVSVRLLARMSPLDFFRRLKLVILTALSTSSSNATLPTALKESEERIGVPREINSFVLTLGANANQHGTALYEGVTILFLAQLAGVDLSLGQQAMVVYLAILGGMGTAGVPAGSIPFIMLVLANLGINPALIAVILGVDRILDMCRTVVNVVGDIAAAAFVARSEGHPLAADVAVPGPDFRY